MVTESFVFLFFCFFIRFFCFFSQPLLLLLFFCFFLSFFAFLFWCHQGGGGGEGYGILAFSISLFCFGCFLFDFSFAFCFSTLVSLGMGGGRLRNPCFVVFSEGPAKDQTYASKIVVSQRRGARLQKKEHSASARR